MSTITLTYDPVTGNLSTTNVPIPVDGSSVTQPVSISGTVPISGSVSITGTPNVAVTNTPTVTVGNASIPVTGTFYQTTQPVSLAVAPTTPVTGTFYQATQPVSIATMPTTPVTGTFYQATQPISGSVSLGVTTGKTVVMKTGTLVTTATTADQVVLTYTVTAAKTFYVEYVEIQGAQTTPAGGTGIVLGTISLENPSGTKVISARFIGGGGEQMGEITIPFAEPIPVSAGVVIRVVTTPAATTSMTWVANFGGYEK
jgi:hypothetical protein